MSDDNEIQNPEPQIESRPPARPNTFFYVMLVLSMVNAGTSVLSNLILGFMAPTMGEMFENGSLPLPEELTEAIRTLTRIPQYYFFIVALFWGLSFYGALSMWKLRKTGFHCYTLAQLILLLIPLVFLGKSYVSLGDIMFTLLFIAYYASVIYFWKKSHDDEDQQID